MRDPRSGFAKSFRRGYAGLGKERLLGGVIAFVSCQACAGSGASTPPAVPPGIGPTASAAAGSSRPRTVALSYVAPAGCPDVATYWRHIRARSSIASVESGGAPTADSPDVRVELSPSESGWVGRLTIAGELELDREVTGERCEDVVEALALITVLRLEGANAGSARVERAGPATSGTASSSSAARAGGTTAAPSSAQPGQAATSPASGSAIPSQTTERQSSATPGESAARDTAAPSASAVPPEAVSPSAPAAPAPAVAPAVPSASEPSASERGTAGAGRDAESGRSEALGEAAPDDRLETDARSADIEPSEDGASTADTGEEVSPSEPRQSASTRVGVAAQAGYGTVPPRSLQGRFEGELRFGENMSSWATTLAFAYARGVSETQEAELEITLLTAELALCPPAFVDAASLWIRACAGVRSGGVHVIITPSDPSQSPADVWRPWLAAGPSLQVGVPLSQSWALRGVFELAVQLVRDRFYVEDTRVADQPERITLYRPAAASFEFGLGLGYTF
jgi:hypothetical protein